MRKSIRGARRVFACTLLVVGGCGRLTEAVTRVAEGTRTATEQMAFRREERDRQRQTEIELYAAAPPSSPLRLVERFETREGPDGFFIYDTQTQSIARIGGQSQSGLTYEQAEDAFAALAYADSKGRSP